VSPRRRPRLKILGFQQTPVYGPAIERGNGTLLAEHGPPTGEVVLTVWVSGLAVDVTALQHVLSRLAGLPVR
jgi:hypothetical protein